MTTPALDDDMTFEELCLAMQSLSRPTRNGFAVDFDEYFAVVHQARQQTCFDFRSYLGSTPPLPAGIVEMKHELMCQILRQSSFLGEYPLVLTSGHQSRTIALPTKYYSAISSNPHIKELVLHTKPTAKELCLIVQMKSNTKLRLEHLDPQRFDLDSASGALLRDAFANNTSLESLMLTELVRADAAELLLLAASHSKISELIVDGTFGGMGSLDGFGTNLSSIVAMLQNPPHLPTLRHVHLINYYIEEPSEMNLLLMSMHENASTVALTIEGPHFSQVMVDTIRQYMNRPMPTRSNNNNNDNGDVISSSSSSPIQEVCFKNIVRGDVRLLENALWQVLNPFPGEGGGGGGGVRGTIGSHLLHLECQVGVISNTSQLFQMLGENAAHIRLQRLLLCAIDETSSPELIDSLPHWIHLKELTVTLSPLRVNVQDLLGALKKNGSLHQANFVSTFTEQEARIAAAYCQRNRSVPTLLSADEFAGTTMVPALIGSVLPIPRALAIQMAIAGLHESGQAVGF